MFDAILEHASFAFPNLSSYLFYFAAKILPLFVTFKLFTKNLSVLSVYMHAFGPAPKFVHLFLVIIKLFSYLCSRQYYYNLIYS